MLQLPRAANKVYLIGDAQRTVLLSRRRSIHVSLGPDDLNDIPSIPTKTHLHCVGVPSGLTGVLPTKRLRIVTSYKRDIVIEYEDTTKMHRDISVLSSQKYCFGPRIMYPGIRVVQNMNSIAAIKWGYHRLEQYQKAVFYEKLREFFCLEGVVPAKVRS